MEKLKGKHNHTLTNILKVFTFALVLLFPFLMFMPSALYYGFNEHAQIEIPQKIGKYQTNEVNSWNDLIENNIYEIDSITLSTDIFYDAHCSEYIEGNLLYFEGNEGFTINSNTIVSINDYNSNELNYIYFYIDSNSMQLYLSNEMAYAEINDNNVQITLNNCVIQLTSINQDLEDYTTYINKTFKSTDFNVYDITETNTISENLSNSWENMWQTPLFAWTDNTPFTATTNAFASVFNISHQSGFYNLVAYFITITAIYLVIDIVIGVATMLTHMITKQD